MGRLWWPVDPLSIFFSDFT
uniref:Uncharacterized protein n=1 Tax=Arundo donax TaxID=35708 RepID=A0A0A9C984_ARUDO